MSQRLRAAVDTVLRRVVVAGENAPTPPTGDVLVTESGDTITTESGDPIEVTS